MSLQVLVLDDDKLAAEWVVAPDVRLILIRRGCDTPARRAEALASLLAATAA